MQHNRSCCYHVNSYLTSTWKLPMLTTLDLHSVTLRDDNADKCISVFSKCANLKNLTLKLFKIIGLNNFRIFHPRLLNLTLENCVSYRTVVNVVAPKLENLTIRSCNATRERYVISAPDLVSLFYKSSYHLHLSTKCFHSLKKVDICVTRPQDADAHQIVCLLQKLHTVNFLKLNLEIIEILSSAADLTIPQPSPFVNLKHLKIYPERVSQVEQAPKKVAMSSKLKSYLLDGSPGITMVLHEEIIAQKLLAEFGALLEKEKDDIKTNVAYLEGGKEPLANHRLIAKTKLKTEGGMAQIKSGWENLGVQIQQRKEKACLIISKLQRIEEILTSLPASNKANIQPCFSSICAQANTAINNITDCLKIQCDENRSRSSVCFHQLATTLEPSS